jgi:hypothetical protein
MILKIVFITHFFSSGLHLPKNIVCANIAERGKRVSRELQGVQNEEKLPQVVAVILEKSQISLLFTGKWGLA